MRIEIKYETGDSLGTSVETDSIELEWESLEMACKCLDRIKNHYEFYKKYGDCYSEPACNLPSGVVWNGKYGKAMLELVTDKGEPYLYDPFWTGYFEKLLKASIVSELTYEP